VVPETNQAAALLDTMYSLAGDKRQTRIAFLSALVKVLDVDLTAPEVQVDGDYLRFIAENLAYLQYRTMEEVYLVIFYLNRIIAGAGTTLLESLLELSSGPATLSGQRKSKKKNQPPKQGNGENAGYKTAKDMNTKASKRPQTSVAGDNESGEDIADGMPGGNDASEFGTSTFSCNGRHTIATATDDDREPTLPIAVMTKASVAVEAAIVLKSYLKRNYDVSESKCQQFQLSTSKTYKEKPQARFKGPAARLHWQWKANDVGILCGRPTTSEGTTPKNGGEAMMRWQLARFRELIEAETVQRIHDEDLITPASDTRKQRRPLVKSAASSDAAAIRRKARSLLLLEESEETEEGDAGDADDDGDDGDDDDNDDDDEDVDDSDSY
jgi:hypothetical protein